VRPGDVAGGPGKLCQAMAVDRAFDGVPLTERGEGSATSEAPSLWIATGEPRPGETIASGPRIGVDYAGEAAAWPLRYALAGNPHVSRPRL
jgi:DNA-3-methyladenine glycosylase